MRQPEYTYMCINAFLSEPFVNGCLESLIALYSKNIKNILYSPCSCADWFESYLLSNTCNVHSGKSVTIRESNHASGVYKEHYV